MSWVVELYCDNTGVKHTLEFEKEKEAKACFNKVHRAGAARIRLEDKRGFVFSIVPGVYTAIMISDVLWEALHAAKAGQPVLYGSTH